MAEHTQDYTPTQYYKVSAMTRRLYKSSKEPKDGYVEVETPSGTYYHKIVNGLSGKISDLSYIESDKFEGLSVTLVDETGEAFNFKTKTDSAGLKPLLRALYNVDFDENILISFYPSKNEQNPDKPYQAVSVGYMDKVKVKTDKGEFYPSPEWFKMEDCPAPITDKRGRLDFREQEDYIYDKCKELVKRFNGGPSVGPKSPENYNNDDLPF